MFCVKTVSKYGAMTVSCNYILKSGVVECGSGSGSAWIWNFSLDPDPELLFRIWIQQNIERADE